MSTNGLTGWLVVLGLLGPVACGDDADLPAPLEPASSEPAPSAAPRPVLNPFVTPPPVTMETSGGRQVGAHGSFCVQGGDLSICADRNVNPHEFTVMPPGSATAFSIADGVFTVREGCTERCPPQVVIERAGPCNGCATELRPVRPEQPWTDLPPGAYWVWLDTYYRGDDGWGGQIYVGFGVIIDPAAPPGVVPASTVKIPPDEAFRKFRGRDVDPNGFPVSR